MGFYIGTLCCMAAALLLLYILQLGGYRVYEDYTRWVAVVLGLLAIPLCMSLFIRFVVHPLFPDWRPDGRFMFLCLWALVVLCSLLYAARQYAIQSKTVLALDCSIWQGVMAPLLGCWVFLFLIYNESRIFPKVLILSGVTVFLILKPLYDWGKSAKVTKNGIQGYRHFVRWQDIANWRWTDGKIENAMLSYQYNLLIEQHDTKQVKLFVPDEHKEAVGNLLTQYAGKEAELDDLLAFLNKRVKTGI